MTRRQVSSTNGAPAIVAPEPVARTAVAVVLSDSTMILKFCPAIFSTTMLSPFAVTVKSSKPSISSSNAAANLSANSVMIIASESPAKASYVNSVSSPSILITKLHSSSATGIHVGLAVAVVIPLTSPTNGTIGPVVMIPASVGPATVRTTSTVHVSPSTGVLSSVPVKVSAVVSST